MIPKVRTWKVTAVETGRVVLVDTINRRFAKWIARDEFGMYGMTLKASLVAPKHTCQSGGAPCEVCREEFRSVRPTSLEDSYAYGM